MPNKFPSNFAVVALCVMSCGKLGSTYGSPAAPLEESSATLTLTPRVRLPGAPVGIRVERLDAGALVILTVERYRAQSNALYDSRSAYRADSAGTIDLSRDTPVAAPWRNVDANGPFWSMTRSDREPEGQNPWSVVTVRADVDCDGTNDLEAQLDMSGDRAGLVELPLGDAFPGGFLLRPAGVEPLPAVILLGGSEGGDSAARGMAPKFATRGYAALGLPYYSPAWGDAEQQFPKLPRAFHEIPLDRLEAVRDWLRARDDIRPDAIGIWGASKGAEFALAGASRIDGFAAVAAIVPSDVIWEGWGAEARGSSFSWRGQALPFVPYLGMGEEFAKRARGQAVRLRLPHDAGRLANPDRVAPARILVENIAAPVFVVGGDEDNTWDSGGMARNIAEVREAAGLETVSIVASSAGHDLSRDGLSPATEVDARVQAEAWPALLRFFDEHLRGGRVRGNGGMKSSTGQPRTH